MTLVERSRNLDFSTCTRMGKPLPSPFYSRKSLAPSPLPCCYYYILGEKGRDSLNLGKHWWMLKRVGNGPERRVSLGRKGKLLLSWGVCLVVVAWMHWGIAAWNAECWRRRKEERNARRAHFLLTNYNQSQPKLNPFPSSSVQHQQHSHQNTTNSGVKETSDW